MNGKEHRFYFTYSTAERNEIKKIREKYSKNDGTEDKLARLRSLDEGVRQKGTAISIAVGVAGSLILGAGLSLILTDLGSALGIFSIILGLVLGVIGIATVALAYPAYMAITKRERQKIAPEIIRLSDELLK